MPVVHENSGLWVKPVNEIPSPEVGGENRFANAALGNDFAGLDRKALGIKMRAHPLMGAQPASLGASQ